MLERIPWELFCEWRQFYDVAPWGDLRDDMRSGIVAATIANVNRDPKRTPRAYRPNDFMPFLRDDARVSHTASYQPITDPEKFNKMSLTIRAAFGSPKRGRVVA